MRKAVVTPKPQHAVRLISMQVPMLAEIITPYSVDKNNRAIRVGDFIVDAGGRDEGGQVIAVAGGVLLFQRREGRQMRYFYNNCEDSIVIASFNEKSGSSHKPETPTPGSKGSDEATRVTAAC